ncbi:hypothetical protein JX265_013364 [Neoarthrinium moseri]|uniref:Berberine/berberine-like domain-containing protein n=1 Tax=Neoarthrinium moseri TaxID=1658444 RepID=A0A9P9W8H9_9PEZI|nr:uncharacterized protein JN550_012200 [Neoarthrinium moseri]KAI1850801.1 hypothetical protein JX265_013364 [Neoarthrinium moseri]KAI1859187.1 hypothetical protein JN550_012200 [Neoarthrinium moseri]
MRQIVHAFRYRLRERQDVFYCTACQTVRGAQTADGRGCASTVDGALKIDMSDINYVHVDKGKQFARVGGGVLLRQLEKCLEEHGLLTPWGIRGGGGIFGAIIELTIKFYPPKEPMAIEFPTVGRIFATLATWADADHDQAWAWFDSVAALGTCIMNTPHAASLQEFTEDNEKLVIWPSNGRGNTISIKKWTRKTVKCLDCGQDHHMVEIISMTGNQKHEGEAAAWASALETELREQDPSNILQASYIALSGDENMDLKRIYGTHYETLLGLKRKYDPGNVFKYAELRVLV